MEELTDLLDSIIVKCQISLFLIQCGKTAWLPTILEHLHEDSQKIIEEYCVKDDS